jgi:anthranilate phosphoribosyltransferase
VTSSAGDTSGERWIEPLRAGGPLRPEDAESLAEALTENKLSFPAGAEILTLLARRGESEEELYAFAKHLRQRAVPFAAPGSGSALDLCGSGGAALRTFNVSTVSAFVVAASGLRVAKHGNSSARGPCGSSDLLEALGLPVKGSRAFAEETFRQEGLAFLHAPLYHPVLAAVGPLRRSLGIRTIFNLLGPLLNPAGVRAQVVGCFDEGYAERVSHVLPRLDVESLIAISGAGGADELSPYGESAGFRVFSSRTEPIHIQADSLLLPEERQGDWLALPPAESARAARELLEGAAGARRGAVLLTAGSALWVAGEVSDLPAGVRRAREVLDSGAALTKLQALQEIAKAGSWS